MITFVVLLLLIAALVILPGWLYFGRTSPQPKWLFAVPVFGIGLWVALTYIGIGAQSLSNVVEVFAVATSAVASAYVKFFLLDRSAGLKSKSTVLILTVVVLTTVCLRLFTPPLPE